MDSDSTKKRIKKWAETDGIPSVVRYMVIDGVSYSLAYSLAAGKYPSELKDRVLRILKKTLDKCA